MPGVELGSGAADDARDVAEASERSPQKRQGVTTGQMAHTSSAWSSPALVVADMTSWWSLT